jgi:hypothetical protein
LDHNIYHLQALYIYFITHPSATSTFAYGKIEHDPERQFGSVPARARSVDPKAGRITRDENCLTTQAILDAFVIDNV